MRVRSHVGGSGDDSEQSDNHESGNPSMLGHGNPSVLEKKWHGCTNDKCALSGIERQRGRPVRRISEGSGWIVFVEILSKRTNIPVPSRRVPTASIALPQIDSAAVRPENPKQKVGWLR